MNDTDPAFASYDRYREALGKASQSNKTVIFDALEAANITSVVTEFDGEGDSGGITGVTAYCGEKEVELPANTVTLQQASWGCTEIRSAEEKLSQAVETLCYDYLQETHGGWENDDGGFGEFRLDVVARTVELEFNARYTDVFTEMHTF